MKTFFFVFGVLLGSAQGNFASTGVNDIHFSCPTAVSAFSEQNLTTRRPAELPNRLFEISFSAMALSVSLPVILTAAIFIKAESQGPVFYKQWRVGKGGIPFQIYKLRSMFHQMPGGALTLKNDPRI